MQCIAPAHYVTLHQNPRDKRNLKFPNCDFVPSVPSQTARRHVVCFELYCWATKEEWTLGDCWATFCQCLPWLQKSLATLITMLCVMCMRVCICVHRVVGSLQRLNGHTVQQWWRTPCTGVHSRLHSYVASSWSRWNRDAVWWWWW